MVFMKTLSTYKVLLQMCADLSVTAKTSKLELVFQDSPLLQGRVLASSQRKKASFVFCKLLVLHLSGFALESRP